MNPESPWKSIRVPVEPDVLNMRRIDPALAWNFFWGRDSTGCNLLVLQVSPSSIPRVQLPRLAGLEVFVRRSPDDKSNLVIQLQAGSASADVFEQLCHDIVANASDASTETEAVTRMIARTWRWHHLLRGGHGPLSAEEQKGLIGELLILESYLIPGLGAVRALAAWRGPLGGTHDFDAVGVCIESKARSSATASEVPISSEFQLASSGTSELFLHVTVLDPPDRQTEGFSLRGVVTRVRDLIGSISAESLMRFDALLEAAGFDSSASEEAFLSWHGGERAIYAVSDDFPRLVPSEIPPGISNVRYDVMLSACNGSVVAPSVLHSAIQRHA